jgi:NCAIR mutase (PurE)-related protein
VDAVKVLAVAELLGQALETGQANTNIQTNGLRHHPEAFCLTVGALPDPDPALGRVTVLAGGSSDLKVAAEAQLALQCHGVACDLLLDVGVAGLHRLLGQLDALRPARVLIACAGMEGALPTVLAGLMPQPVIGVPVSVGYGVSAGGHAALQGMLASCAPGLTVVNIDNGYGAAMAALRILAVPRP